MENTNDFEDFLELIKENLFIYPEQDMKKLIGVGPIGKVYSITFSQENYKNLALKVIPKEIPKNKFMPYVNFMKNFKKPYLAKMYSYFEDNKYYYIIMENYKYNLNNIIKDGISLKNIFKIFDKLNTYLTYLNAKNIIFRNIKPENIFIINNNGNLDEDFDIILSDCFSGYLMLYPKYDIGKNYFAPETKIDNIINEKSDIYSLGKLLFYMIFNVFLQDSDFIINERSIQCIKDEKFRKFILSLLEKDIKKRLSWFVYLKDFANLKNEFYNKNKNEIIDLSKLDTLNELNGLFKLSDEFDNIVIKLTELSKEQYVNENILCPEDFDKRGNRHPFEYSRNQKRGNELYDPPLGWTGIGLNITKYDYWKLKCGKSNTKGEWCVAYHGTNITNAKNIIMKGLEKGIRQNYENHLDKYGNQIGEGVYFSPKIEIAERYSVPYLGIKCVFMCRVNPEKMKVPHQKEIYIINDPDIDIIPYRLLIKKE